jgi:hypothetical protein
LVEESLVIVNCPVVGPTIAGINSTFNVAVCPGFKVTGKFIPEIVNPLPLTVSALIFTGVDPEEVKTIDCVTEPFTATLPKDTLCALMVKIGPEVPPLWLDPETGFSVIYREKQVLPWVFAGNGFARETPDNGAFAQMPW